MISGYYNTNGNIYIGDTVKIKNGIAERCISTSPESIDKEIGIVLKINEESAYVVDLTSSGNLVFKIEG